MLRCNVTMCTMVPYNVMMCTRREIICGETRPRSGVKVNVGHRDILGHKTMTMTMMMTMMIMITMVMTLILGWSQCQAPGSPGPQENIRVWKLGWTRYWRQIEDWRLTSPCNHIAWHCIRQASSSHNQSFFGFNYCLCLSNQMWKK